MKHDYELNPGEMFLSFIDLSLLNLYGLQMSLDQSGCGLSESKTSLLQLNIREESLLFCTSMEVAVKLSFNFTSQYSLTGVRLMGQRSTSF